MKYHLFILGCAMNYSDAERLVAVLESLGYSRAKNESEADLIVTIACSVRQTAIDRIYGKSKRWKELRKKNKELRIFLTGCVLDKDKRNMDRIFDGVFDIKDLTKLPKLLIQNNDLKIDNLDLNGNWKLEIENYEDYFKIHPNYESSFRAYVPISTGCNNFCTYCAVPYTKGREKSRQLEDVVSEVRDLVGNGYKEITLLGQNVNSYGQDLLSVISSNQGESRELSASVEMTNNNKFIELLKEIDRITGDYRVYFYSNHPKDMSDELIELMPKLKHFPAYIHLPLQSGDDEIIRKMNRHYTKEKYLELVEKIRKAMPEVTLTTDIIVGFPGETEAQFAETVEVMEAAKFDMAFLAQYSERPGTVAAKMVDNVAKSEKKRREAVLQKILEKTAKGNNQKLVGQTVRVLVDEEKKGKLYGRTDGYKVVEIEDRNYPEQAKRFEGSQEISRQARNDKSKTDRKDLIGRFCDVKIESATAWKLSGKLAF